jgi:hypothetical protein
LAVSARFVGDTLGSWDTSLDEELHVFLEITTIATHVALITRDHVLFRIHDTWGIETIDAAGIREWTDS